MSFPASLVAYLHSKLVKSLSIVNSGSVPHGQIANEILHQIAVISADDTRKYHSMCECIARGISNNEIEFSFEEILQDVERYYNCLVERKQKNKAAFVEITKHHRNISQCDSLNISSNEVYSKSAFSMGKKMWVKAGNAWMSSYAYKYFYDNGAEASYYKLQKQFGDSSKRSNTKGMCKKSKCQYTLIDIGSCYNPLESNNVDNFNIIALDLHPAPCSDVYQCNFLDLIVGPSNSELIRLPDKSSEENTSSDVNTTPLSKFKLIQLPGETGDVCCLSLVLSFLPSPSMRYQMVQKARLLLKTPVNTDYNQDYDDSSMKGGLLLIVEKESVMNRSKRQDKGMINIVDHWQKVIESIGFVLIHYQLLAVDNEGRKSHIFAFRTTKTSTSSSSSNDGKLYIKQELENKV